MASLLYNGTSYLDSWNNKTAPSFKSDTDVHRKHIFFSLELLTNCLTIILNFWTLVVMYRCRTYTSPGQLLLKSLVLTDLLQGTVRTIIQLTTEFSGRLHMTVYHFIYGIIALSLTTMCSNFHLCLISIDRSLAIFKPLRYSSIVTHYFAVKMIISSWALSFMVNLPCILWPVYQSTFPFEYLLHYWLYSSYVLFAFLSATLFVVYVKIGILVRKQHRKIQSACRAPGNPTVIKASAKLLLILLTYFITWTPYLVLNLVVHFYDVVPDNATLAQQICKILSYTNSIVNVFIYAGCDKQLRAAFNFRHICIK